MSAVTSDGLRSERRGKDLYITLARPSRGNALTFEAIHTLTTEVERAGKDKVLRRILLCADGKHFCAGVDLGAGGGVLEANAETKQRQWHMIQRLFQTIQNSPKITIAVVSGPAHGAGVGLVFACDFRIAVANADFHIGEARLGMAPAVLMQLIMREWGLARAREAMLTARAVSPKELERARVVHVVVDDAIELQNAVDRYVAHIDMCGPEALASIKKFVLAPEAEQNDMARRMYDRMMKPSEEAREGIKSFYAKRPPCWTQDRSTRPAKI